MSSLARVRLETPDPSHLTSPREEAWSKRAVLPALGSSASEQSPPSAGLAEDTQEASPAQDPSTQRGCSLQPQSAPAFFGQPGSGRAGGQKGKGHHSSLHRVWHKRQLTQSCPQSSKYYHNHFTGGKAAAQKLIECLLRARPGDPGLEPIPGLAKSSRFPEVAWLASYRAWSPVKTHLTP